MIDTGEILIVDDTHASLKLLADILTAKGYQVRPSDSGELALSSVASKLPELILLDIRMPGIDGFEVLRRLKAREESRNIPVIFLSASVEMDERIEGLKLGAVDFVSKPFQAEELLARVQTHMELHRMRVRLERQAIELRQSEEKLKEAQHIARLGNWELDLLKKTLLWSDGIYKLFEINPTEFGASYEAFLNAIHPDDRVMVDHAYTESLKNRTPYEISHRLLMKDGRIKWVNEICRTEYDIKGNPLKSFGIVQDITERKRVEEALVETSKEREKLIKELQLTLDNVKTLQGLIPICASCKKIRDDKGFWNQVEGYIMKHSDAKFSHGVCPECAKKLYGDLYDRVIEEQKKKTCSA